MCWSGSKERSSLENDMNDVPLAVAAFFRSPTVVWLHSGFVWQLQGTLQLETSQVRAEGAQHQRHRGPFAEARPL